MYRIPCLTRAIFGFFLQSFQVQLEVGAEIQLQLQLQVERLPLQWPRHQFPFYSSSQTFSLGICPFSALENSILGMATKDISFCNAKHTSLAGAAICFALATSCVWTPWICLSSARNQRPCRFQLRLDLARKDLYYDHSPAFSVKHRGSLRVKAHSSMCAICVLYASTFVHFFSLFATVSPGIVPESVGGG